MYHELEYLTLSESKRVTLPCASLGDIESCGLLRCFKTQGLGSFCQKEPIKLAAIRFEVLNPELASDPRRQPQTSVWWPLLLS